MSQHNNNNLKTARVIISGMTCKSCEILIERKWKKLDGMVSVQVDHSKGYADLVYNKTPEVSALRHALSDTHYVITPWDGKKSSLPRATHSFRNYAEAGGIMIILLSIYLIGKNFNLIPKLSITEGMSYGFIFLIGIVAATSTCIAVAGGLLLAATARYAEQHPDAKGWKSFKPVLFFNIGRVSSYVLFGGLIGFIGSALAPSQFLTGLITIAASIVMIIVGCRLLHIFPALDRFIPRPPKGVSHFLHDYGERHPKFAPFILGASTFFLPCGFTQSLQLYVLSRGNPVEGAVTMFFFVMGTVPALLSLGALSSFVKGKAQHTFLKFAGSLLVLIGLMTVNNGFALAGVTFPKIDFTSPTTGAPVQIPAARMENGKQIIDMSVEGLEYTVPNFTVRQGVPFEWRVDGRRAVGCAQILTVPGMNMTQYLSGSDVTKIEFTPSQTGTFAFRCAMGMTTRGASFTVIPNS
ncbi:MAG: sulfite exporter TauE/SafE family protein [Candidatus Uhrbacteria bacterium]|nr:sulfite exporter TauE/SafE family protein [Candidatus Uhrbacteria bacterium]